MPDTIRKSVYATITLYKDGKQVGHTELFSPRREFMGIILNNRFIPGYKENNWFVDHEFSDCEIRSQTAKALVYPKTFNRYNNKGEWVGYDYEDPKIISKTRYFKSVEDACRQKDPVGLGLVSRWTYAHQVGFRPRTVTHVGYLDRHNNLIMVRTRE